MVKVAVTESEFYMWRTLFAIAHADDIVTCEEVRYLSEVLEDVPFSVAQKTRLQRDISESQNIEDMFEKIGDPKDQAAFFNFARKVVWVDDRYCKSEQKIMLKLKQIHIRSVDVDLLVGSVKLDFEDGNESYYFKDVEPSQVQKKSKFENIVYCFCDNFVNEKLGN